jgi:hypothetical protein
MVGSKHRSRNNCRVWGAVRSFSVSSPSPWCSPHFCAAVGRTKPENTTEIGRARRIVRRNHACASIRTLLARTVLTWFSTECSAGTSKYPELSVATVTSDPSNLVRPTVESRLLVLPCPSRARLEPPG